MFFYEECGNSSNGVISKERNIMVILIRLLGSILLFPIIIEIGLGLETEKFPTKRLFVAGIVLLLLANVIEGVPFF